MAKKRGVALTTQAEKRLLKAFGERVFNIREQKNLAVYDLTGDDMPIKSRQHWRRIEKGEKNINITTVFRVAESLKVAPEELIKNLK